MENKLDIAPTSVTPEIRFNIEERKFLIQGRSMPEDTEAYYSQIIQWVRKNLNDQKITANFDVVLEYYNTGSFIRLMTLFILLVELNKKGNKFSVRWFCEEDDQDNIDSGQSFKDVLDLPFTTHFI
ncbi:MAG: DUF1987 domain-containing protein [Flavobacteriales bacterium]|nr:DUF1987 domain-containing protein [Flavobacteriales bacterium]